jgi:ribosomal protein S18 acetylase RimI-like enzyme
LGRCWSIIRFSKSVLGKLMSSQGVLIRQFKHDDYDRIIRLWSSANLPIRPKGRDSYEKIKAQIRGGSTILLVAESNGKVVGTVLGTHDGRKGWINRLAVDTEFRRKNIAKQLVSQAEKWFEEIGLEVFACVIEGNNIPSIELFKKLGYEEWDVRYFSKRKSQES